MTLFQKVPEIKAEKKDSTLLGAIAYLPMGRLIVPLLIVLLAKEDRFAKFHGLNSLGIDLAMILIGFVLSPILLMCWLFMMLLVPLTTGIATLIWIPIFFILIGLLAFGQLALFVLYLYFMYLAHNGDAFRIPFITERIMGYL